MKKLYFAALMVLIVAPQAALAQMSKNCSSYHKLQTPSGRNVKGVDVGVTQKGSLRFYDSNYTYGFNPAGVSRSNPNVSILSWIQGQSIRTLTMGPTGILFDEYRFRDPVVAISPIFSVTKDDPSWGSALVAAQLVSTLLANGQKRTEVVVYDVRGPGVLIQGVKHVITQDWGEVPQVAVDSRNIVRDILLPAYSVESTKSGTGLLLDSAILCRNFGLTSGNDATCNGGRQYSNQVLIPQNAISLRYQYGLPADLIESGFKTFIDTQGKLRLVGIISNQITTGMDLFVNTYDDATNQFDFNQTNSLFGLLNQKTIPDYTLGLYGQIAYINRFGNVWRINVDLAASAQQFGKVYSRDYEALAPNEIPALTLGVFLSNSTQKSTRPFVLSQPGYRNESAIEISQDEDFTIQGFQVPSSFYRDIGAIFLDDFGRSMAMKEYQNRQTVPPNFLGVGPASEEILGSAIMSISQQAFVTFDLVAPKDSTGQQELNIEWAMCSK